MDKQMIEEMAKVIEEAMAKARRTIGGHNNIANFYATMLYNAGYRKILEGAVVLTGEEHKQMLKDLIESNEKAKEIASKETAEKFAERVKMAFYYHFDELIPSIMAKDIDEICKEFTGGK